MIPENIIAIEFFSGIGGWAQALKLLNSSSSTTMDDNPIDHRVIKCFDCNEVANKSYEYNFKHISNVNPKNIEKLSEKDLLMIDNINKKEQIGIEGKIWILGRNNCIEFLTEPTDENKRIIKLDLISKMEVEGRININN